MKIRILGAHHAESKDTKLVSFLIDDIIAVDAGSLSTELSFSEQEKIKSILLSHGHYDHIRGVPSFIFNNLKRVIQVYGTHQTLEILSSHLLDGIIYPNFTKKTPFLEKPPINLMPLKPYHSTDVEGYHILPLPTNHIDGSIGFEITSKDGGKVFFTGDTGPGLSDIWEHISPQLIIIDVTFPNRFEDTAKNAGHLCPKMLKKELKEFQKIKSYLPKVLLIHLNPKLEKEIKKETQVVAKELNISIGIAYEGEKITI